MQHSLPKSTGLQAGLVSLVAALAAASASAAPAPGAPVSAARTVASHAVVPARVSHSVVRPPPSGLGYRYAGYRGGRHVGSHGWSYPWRSSLWVIAPPIGLTIPFLPYDARSVWIGERPYYYADEVRYERLENGDRSAEPERDGVTWQGVPDRERIAPTPRYVRPPVPAPTDELVITPRNRQTATQLSFDRIDCERAAITATGFDPAAATIEAVRKADFVKAVSSCLEAKGYSVK